MGDPRSGRTRHMCSSSRPRSGRSCCISISNAVARPELTSTEVAVLDLTCVRDSFATECRSVVAVSKTEGLWCARPSDGLPNRGCIRSSCPGSGRGRLMMHHRTWMIVGTISMLAACSDEARSPADPGPDPDETPPTAVIDLLSAGPTEGDSVHFRVRSTDDRGLASRIMSFGDGTADTATLGGTFDDDTLWHVYSAGDFEPSVAYRDASGLQGTASIPVRVSPRQWWRIGDMPHPVRYAAAAEFDGMMYVIGGASPGGARAGYTQIYDPSTGEWSLGPVMPAPADYLVAVSSSLGVHVLGGADETGVLSTHRLFDPVDGTWSLLAPSPVAQDGATAEVLEQRLFLFGGTPGGRQWLDDVQIYDLVADTWGAGTPIPGPRISPASLESGGLIHLFGGGLPELETSDEHLIYDPGSDAWSVGPALPAARETLGAGIVGVWMCVFGGRLAGAGGITMPFGETYCLEPGASTWTAESAMEVPRAELASATHDGWIYALGGHDDTGTPTAVVERFRR